MKNPASTYTSHPLMFRFLSKFGQIAIATIAITYWLYLLNFDMTYDTKFGDGNGDLVWIIQRDKFDFSNLISSFLYWGACTVACWLPFFMYFRRMPLAKSWVDYVVLPFHNVVNINILSIIWSLAYTCASLFTVFFVLNYRLRLMKTDDMHPFYDPYIFAPIYCFFFVFVTLIHYIVRLLIYFRSLYFRRCYRS